MTMDVRQFDRLFAVGISGSFPVPSIIAEALFKRPVGLHAR